MAGRVKVSDDVEAAARMRLLYESLHLLKRVVDGHTAISYPPTQQFMQQCVNTAYGQAVYLKALL